MPKTSKQKAWDEFSKFIRLRDCVRTTNTLDWGACVTCDRQYAFKRLQAGHFISGRSNSVLLDEDIVHAQCFGCNGNPPYGKGGNYVEYFVRMEKLYGREAVDIFQARKRTGVKIADYEWDAFAAHYKARRIEIEIAWRRDKYGAALQHLIRLGVTLEKS